MDGQDEEVIDRNNNYNNNNNNDNLKKDTEKDIEGDVEEGGGQQSIVKRKRTRREKRQSPTPLRMIATSTNSSKSDQDSDICSNNNMVDDNITTAATTTATTTTTTTTITIDKDRENTNIFNNIVTTKEEEEVAKCLILLAQSHPCPSQSIQNFSKSSGRSYNNNNNDNNSNDNNSDNNNGTKFISRKFMEASSSTGKFGYYVYECKTCGKNFTSFQALGGHRASHKKPKYNKDEDYNNKGKSNQIYSNANSSRNTSRSNYITNLLFSSDDEDPPFKLTKLNNNSNNNSTSLSLQLANRSSYSNCITNHQSNNKRSRVHECSICGSEFTSGQALGGHMRRHRGLVTNNLPIAATPLTIEQPSNDVTQIPEDTMINTTITMAPPRNIKRSNSALSVDLDLNLPAPSEDNLGDDHQKEFKSILESNELPDEQSPSTQQVVLSSSSIVDCDY